MSWQYNDGASNMNSGDFATLDTLESFNPPVGALEPVIQTEASEKMYLNASRSKNMRVNNPPYRSGYASLAGNSRPVGNGDYFSLGRAYGQR